MPATLCYVRHDGKVLLQLKASDRFGGGRINGPGGKILPGESPAEGAIREVREETTLRLNSVTCHGTISFVFGMPERLRLFVYVFSCQDYVGRARGGAEGSLRWYPETRIPYDKMWPDNRFWLPLVLAGGSLSGTCVSTESGERMLSCKLELEWNAEGASSAAWHPRFALYHDRIDLSSQGSGCP